MNYALCHVRTVKQSPHLEPGQVVVHFDGTWDVYEVDEKDWSSFVIWVNSTWADETTDWDALDEATDSAEYPEVYINV